jgi:hypothetical protein
MHVSENSGDLNSATLLKALNSGATSVGQEAREPEPDLGVFRDSAR